MITWKQQQWPVDVLHARCWWDCMFELWCKQKSSELESTEHLRFNLIYFFSLPSMRWLRLQQKQTLLWDLTTVLYAFWHAASSPAIKEDRCIIYTDMFHLWADFVPLAVLTALIRQPLLHRCCSCGTCSSSHFVNFRAYLVKLCCYY